MSRPDDPDTSPHPRPWWKDPRYAGIAAALVVVIGVGGYFGINTQRPHAAQPTSRPRPLVHVDGLPPGATRCDRVYKSLLVPFNSSAPGTPVTTCGFAEQVRVEYAKHSSTQSGVVSLKVVSPTTELQYDVTCLANGVYATCSGGAAAVIYLYNRTAP